MYLLCKDCIVHVNVIYVENVLALGQPNLEIGVFGICTIDGERIMYRDVNLVDNSVSGLMRGTAGTAAAPAARPAAAAARRCAARW